MRKSSIPEFGANRGISNAGSWLDIEAIASAELSSEDPRHPFEQALRADTEGRWKASTSGPQLIRLRFDHPQAIKRIHLRFSEREVNRSQEIALFATSNGAVRRELVRQQWSFNLNSAPTEVEDYYFDLKELSVLELEIDPGRHDKQVFASLQSIQIG